MSFKDLLVQVDTSKAAKKRVEAAVDLAERFGAHMTGLVTLGVPLTPSYLRSQIPQSVIDAQKKYLADMDKQATETFERVARNASAGYEVRHLKAPEGDLAAKIALHARYCDLVVLGQQDEDDSASLDSSIVEEVMMTCGRPVLMIPYIGAPAHFGKRIMVAWNSGREATRAVNDALPLLQKADQVVVVAVNPERGPHGDEPGADIALHLARHGVKVEVQHLEAPDIAISDAILSRVSDRDSDLLVMGGYGHSRLRELVLGGVTHEVMQHMTVPVLLSH
jgi:nucleotide-binding universal stress UspA family protein